MLAICAPSSGRGLNLTCFIRSFSFRSTRTFDGMQPESPESLRRLEDCLESKIEPMSLTWLATIQSQRRLWRVEYHQIEMRDPLRVNHCHDERYSRIKHGQKALFSKLSVKDQQSTNSAFAHAAQLCALRILKNLKAKNFARTSAENLSTNLLLNYQRDAISGHFEMVSSDLMRGIFNWFVVHLERVLILASDFMTQ